MDRQVYRERLKDYERVTNLLNRILNGHMPNYRMMVRLDPASIPSDSSAFDPSTNLPIREETGAFQYLRRIRDNLENLFLSSGDVSKEFLEESEEDFYH